MRRQAKAPFARPTSGRESVHALHPRLLALFCFAVAALALTASPAFAVETHPYSGISFGPEGPAGSASFASVQGVAVDQASGDVYVHDAGEGKIYKFDAGGEPLKFSALPGNAIEGVGAAAAGGAENELAIAPAGSPGGTAGDIYLAKNSAVLVYAPSGEKLAELTRQEIGGETCGVAVNPAGHPSSGSIRTRSASTFPPPTRPRSAMKSAPPQSVSSAKSATSPPTASATSTPPPTTAA